MQSSDAAFKAGYVVGQVLTLGVGVLLIAAMVVCLVMAIRRKTTGWIVGAAVSGLLVLGGIAVAVFAAVTGIVSAAAKAEKIDQKLASADGRYSLSVPHGWKTMNQLNKEALISSGNPVREQYMIVLAEPKGEFKGSAADYSKVTSEHIVASLKDPQLGEPEAVESNGLKGIQRRIDGEAQGVAVIYLHTVFDTPDQMCQVICWTLKGREKAALPVFKNVVATFMAGAAQSPSSLPGTK